MWALFRNQRDEVRAWLCWWSVHPACTKSWAPSPAPYRAWWLTPVIPVLGGWRQDDQEFQVILSYIVSFMSVWET